MRQLFTRRATAGSSPAPEPVDVAAKLRRLNDAVRANVDWAALENLGLVEPGTAPSDLLDLSVRPTRDENFIVRASGLALEVDVCDVSELVRLRTGVWVIDTVPAAATATH